MNQSEKTMKAYLRRHGWSIFTSRIRSDYISFEKGDCDNACRQLHYKGKNYDCYPVIYIYYRKEIGMKSECFFKCVDRQNPNNILSGRDTAELMKEYYISRIPSPSIKLEEAYRIIEIIKRHSDESH